MKLQQQQHLQQQQQQHQHHPSQQHPPQHPQQPPQQQQQPSQAHQQSQPSSHHHHNNPHRNHHNPPRHQHHNPPRHHHHNPQPYMQPPNNSIAHQQQPQLYTLEQQTQHHNQPQQPPTQAQQVPVGALPTPTPPVTGQQQSQQLPNNQHNPLAKHHAPLPQPSQPQPVPMANSQLHQPPQHHPHQHPHPQQQQQHHHNQHHHSQQPQHQHQHQLHAHPTQMPISPSMPPQQWVGHPQHQHQQHQTPNAQPQAVVHHSQQQQHQPHHMAHQQGHPVLINQQYPNANIIYTQMGHPAFMNPAGHPQYEHPSATSHPPDSHHMNPQQQQPGSINNHHSTNISLASMPPQTVISSAPTGTTNVHHINNGPMMDAHMPNRLPPNQQPYPMMGHYMPNPFIPMVSYSHPNPNAFGPGHILPPSPALMPPIRGDLGIRQPYDPQNPAVTPLATPSMPPGAKPPVGPVHTPATALPMPTNPKPRERKALLIKDPVTLRAYTVAELLDKPTTPQTPSSQSSTVAPEASSKEQSTSEVKEAVESGTTVQSSTSSDPPKDEVKLTPPGLDTPTPSSTLEVVSPPKPISPSLQDSPKSEETEGEKKSIETKADEVDSGATDSKRNEEEVLIAKVEALEISGNNDAVAADEVKEEQPKQTLANLPYEAGQFSPLNREGNRRYSIKFLKAVAKEMNIELDSSSSQNHRFDFAPHYFNQNSSANFKEFSSSSQPLMRRSSQQVINKPRKIITTHSLQQEVELKTAEKPWKPELEEVKSKIVEDGEMDTKRLLKVFRGHLNKLTPQKYDSLIEKIRALDLDGPERLNSVIDLVFDKAVDEPGFCELYARVCKVIAAKDQEFCFHLVKKCQTEFETHDLYTGLKVEERKTVIEKEDDLAKRKIMSEELYEDMRLRRKKYLGTIKLIGEMYKLGLLIPKIIGLCMHHLIREASNENVECLCSLITTVGAKMASESDDNIKSSLKNTLDILYQIAHTSKFEKVFTVESRIKFKILDTIDLSRRNWKPRMVESNPKKIEEIREEAREELLRQNQQSHHNHSSQPKNSMKSDDRDRANRRPGGHLHNAFAKGSGSKW